MRSQPMPYLHYKMAHDPMEEGSYYIADEEEVLAEVLCHLANIYECSPLQMLILAHDHIPCLDELTMTYLGRTMYVVLLPLLEDSSVNVWWIWKPEHLYRAARLQHAPYYDQNWNWLPQPDMRLRYPSGPPISYRPLQTERGGAKREEEPRQKMMAWAMDKVRSHAPAAEGLTLKMILRAEGRTVTSLMNSKNPTQTKEIIIAAFRRAGLPNPFLPQPRVHEHDVGPQLDAMVHAMLEQTKITQQIADSFQSLPSMHQYQSLLTYMQQIQTSYIETVRSLTLVVGKLEQRIQTWETTLLPHLIDRLPVPRATTPQSCPTTPVYEDTTQTKKMKVAQSEQVDVEEDEYVEGERVTEDGGATRDQVPTGPLDVLRERSLRACCAKLIEAQAAPTPTAKPAALRPFKAKA